MEQTILKKIEVASDLIIKQFEAANDKDMTCAFGLVEYDDTDQAMEDVFVKIIHAHNNLMRMPLDKGPTDEINQQVQVFKDASYEFDKYCHVHNIDYDLCVKFKKSNGTVDKYIVNDEQGLLVPVPDDKLTEDYIQP